MTDQKHAIADLDRKIAEIKERIVALRYRASEKAALFSLVADTLTQENPEYVVGENQPYDPSVAPWGMVVSIPMNLLETTVKITDDLRTSIKELKRLEALRRGAV